jgi:hypothetical protein
MRVFVRSLEGRTWACEGESVADIEACVQSRGGVARADQRLVYGGRQLECGALLRDYNVQPRATLHLSLRLHGGLPWGRILMCVQALQLVWPTVRSRRPASAQR